jgi:hypothetical protein
VRSTVARTENLPSSKRIEPVRRFPFSNAGASDLISMMYEAVLSAVALPPQRPVAVNGIPDFVSRGDLSSRTIFIRLTPIRQRRTERDLWQAFNEAAPGILGALLDVLTAALGKLATTRLPDNEADLRMADFAMLAIAAETSLGWSAGAAVATLRRNAHGAAALMTDLDPVAVAIRALIERDREFNGHVSLLHARLTQMTDQDIRRAPGWPKDATRLGGHLRRLAPSLRIAGINIVERRAKSGMTVIINATAGDPSAHRESEKEERPKTDAPATPRAENGGNAGDWGVATV